MKTFTQEDIKRYWNLHYEEALDSEASHADSKAYADEKLADWLFRDDDQATTAAPSPSGRATSQYDGQPGQEHEPHELVE